ncbi:MAG: hypothetical protein D3914_00345 [Candidatus Electrothrix sp. LOE2]|nr:hypothetical protein [Candidatus Electrothrix sp. LOE2]
MLFQHISFAEESSKSLTVQDMAQSELKYNIAKFEKDIELLEVRNNYYEARVMHQKKLLALAEKSYRTQHWMTVGVFWIVSILVLGGFILSYLQIKNGISNEKSNGADQATFKIGKSGIEFSSSVIGLVVLFMSFMFFHLYVKDVYSLKVNKMLPIEFKDPTK